MVTAPTLIIGHTGTATYSTVGDVNMMGGILNVSTSLYFGDATYGNGEMTMNGGTLNYTGTGGVFLIASYAATSKGKLTVNSGAVINSASNTHVGRAGSGELIINGSGKVKITGAATMFQVGSLAGSTGSMTMNGGILDTAGHVYIGTLTSNANFVQLNNDANVTVGGQLRIALDGATSVGRLTIAGSAAQMKVAGAIGVGFDGGTGSAKIELQAGTLTGLNSTVPTGFVINSDGTINITGGTLILPISQLAAVNGYIASGRIYSGDGDKRCISVATTATQVIVTADDVNLAHKPSPSNAAVNVDIKPVLSWEAGDAALSHKVYFGTNLNTLVFKGNQPLASTTFDPGRLSFGQTYYWRIDEVTASGDVTGAFVAFHRGKIPYGWFKMVGQFPSYCRHKDLATAITYHCNIAFNINSGQQDPGWALYGQKLNEVPGRITTFHNAGLKSICYFETFGDSYCYLAELDNPSKSIEYNTTHSNHWNWQAYGGGERVWVGMKNFWDDEVFARPWTRTHPVYGGPQMTYPNGTVATGYFDNNSLDPRKSRTYDASTSKDILGNLSIGYGYNAAINAINPVTGLPYGPLGGTLYIPADNQYASLVLFSKDSACPLFADFTYASTLYAADKGLDGMWSDNYSPWNSFGNEPARTAFGDWSVARFRTYLQSHFTTAQLLLMGVTDVLTFDIRTKLKAIATSSYGWPGGTDLGHSAWDNLGWQNEPLWQAYIIFKRQAGTEALTNYYNAVHNAANTAGIEDFLVQGNDIPIISLGWPRDNVDMVSTEISSSGNLCSGSRGFMMPPIGRIAPAYKVAREHAKSRFVNVWFFDNGYETYRTNPGICKVLYYEMLSTHTMPMFFPGITQFSLMGDQQTDSDFFGFVETVEPIFGKRAPVEDIGIYYSSSSILNQILPGGIIDFENQPHQFAVWGWATALGQLQYQYRAVPEWKLSDLLSSLRVLIIPESEVFEPNDITNTLQPWVNNGGLLIVTGVGGKRLDENGNFAVRSSGYCLSPLTGVTGLSTIPSWQLQTIGSGKVLYIKDNIGMSYFKADTTRPSLLTGYHLIKDAMDTILQSKPPVAITPGTGVSSSVGLVLYQDVAAGKIFIDVVNYNINLSTDQMTDTPQLTFTVQLPTWLQGKTLLTHTISPDTEPSVQISFPQADRVVITLGPVHHYASVIIEMYQNADINRDNRVNLKDFSMVASGWMEDNNCDASNNWCDQTDIDKSKTIDWGDIQILAENWLAAQ